MFSCPRDYLAACIFLQNWLSKHFLNAASSSACPLRFIVLHILSARAAAEMTLYICAEDQTFNKVYSFWLSQVHVPQFTLFSLSDFHFIFYLLNTFFFLWMSRSRFFCPWQWPESLTIRQMDSIELIKSILFICVKALYLQSAVK